MIQDVTNHSLVFVEERQLPQSTMEQLEIALNYLIKEMDGDIAIYTEDLLHHEAITINDHPMQAASLIKLFTAGRYYQAVEQEEIKETEASKKAIERMIEYSDNDAWTYLETYIGNGSYTEGLTSVTDFAHELGCLDSVRLSALNHEIDTKADNLSSVSDIGKVLSMIYEGTFVSEDTSKQMLELLKKQTRTSKIPKGIPNDYTIANKTGELENTQNDAALIYLDNIDYSLVIMMDDIQDSQRAIENIIDISKTVYHYMHDIH